MSAMAIYRQPQRRNYHKRKSGYGKVYHSSWNAASKKIFCAYQLASNGSTMRYGFESLSTQYFDNPENGDDDWKEDVEQASYQAATEKLIRVPSMLQLAGNLPSLDGRTMNRKGALALLKSFINRTLDATKDLVTSAATASGERKAREELLKKEKQISQLQQELVNERQQTQEAQGLLEQVKNELRESKALHASTQAELDAERGKREGLEAIVALKESAETTTQNAGAKALQDKDAELQEMGVKNAELQSEVEKLKAQLADNAAQEAAQQAEQEAKEAEEYKAKLDSVMSKKVRGIQALARLQNLYRKAQVAIASVKQYRRAHALGKVKNVGLQLIKSMAVAHKHQVEKKKQEKLEAERAAELEAQQQRLKQLEEEAKRQAEAKAAEERRKKEEEERAKEAQRLAEEAERMKPDSKELLKVAESGPVGFGAEGAKEVSEQLTQLVKERHTSVESLDSVGRSPLLVAAASGCVDAVSTLIDLGADIAVESVDKVDALGYAVKNGRDMVTSYLLGQSVGEGAPQLGADKLPSLKRIHAAIDLATEKEDEVSLKVLEAILNSDHVKGPASDALNQHDAKESSVLFAATVDEKVQVVKLLCACKSIKLDADHEAPSSQNLHGLTALQWAVHEAASLLVSGESEEVQDSVKKLIEIARHLLAAGAKTELRHSTGSSLGDATLSGSVLLTEMILEAISPDATEITAWSARAATLLCKFSVLQDVMKKSPKAITEKLGNLIYRTHGISVGRIKDGMTFDKTAREITEDDIKLAKEAAAKVFKDDDLCTFDIMKNFLYHDEDFHSLRDRYGKRLFRETMDLVLMRLAKLASRSSTIVKRAAFEHWYASDWMSMQASLKQHVHVSKSMVKNMSVDEIINMAQSMKGDGGMEPDSELLMDAVNEGDLATAINLIVKCGTDIDSTAEDGYTALMRGSIYDQAQCVEALIKLKANLNHVAEDGCTALIIAAYQNNSNITRALCQFGKSKLNVGQPMRGNNANALYLAAQEGHADILKEMLAIPGGMPSEVLNAQVKGGISATYIAAYEGHTDVLEALVTAKADMNLKSDQGATPLFVSLQNRHHGCTEVLLKHGADPNTTTSDGTSVLSVAIFDGDVEAVKALLKAGVSLAEPKEDDSAAKGKGKKGKDKDKLTSNTPDVGAAFVGYFDILGMIVTEMNRLNIPTRYEPIIKSIHKLTLEQALTIKFEDLVTETKKEQHDLGKEWFEKYGKDGKMTMKQLRKNMEKIGLRKRYGKYFNSFVSLLFHRSDVNNKEYLTFEHYARNIEHFLFLKAVPTGKQLEKAKQKSK